MTAGAHPHDLGQRDPVEDAMTSRSVAPITSHPLVQPDSVVFERGKAGDTPLFTP